MKELVRWVAKGFAWAGGLALAGLLAAAFAPTFFGYQSMIVTSDSMGDAMPVGSVAITQMVDVRSVHVGDVVAFQRPGSRLPVTHRVIAIRGDAGLRAFVTKGDAAVVADREPVTFSGGEISRVEHVVPLAGRIVGYARTPGGGLVLIVAPIAGLTLDRRRRRRLRPRHRPTAEPVGWSVSTLALSVKAASRQAAGRPLPAPRVAPVPRSGALPAGVLGFGIAASTGIARARPPSG